MRKKTKKDDDDDDDDEWWAMLLWNDNLGVYVSGITGHYTTSTINCIHSARTQHGAQRGENTGGIFLPHLPTSRGVWTQILELRSPMAALSRSNQSDY